jgi:hypothetical protein
VISVVERSRLRVPPERAWRFFLEEIEDLYRLAFPSSLARTGGSFGMEPHEDGGCQLIQDVHIGFSWPLLGGLIDLVIAAVVPVGDLRRHMEEQGELPRLLGAGRSTQGGPCERGS